MRCSKTLLVAFVVLCSFVCVATARQSAEQDVRQACSGCHGLKKVCVNLGSANAEAWEAIVHRMVANGAYLEDERVAPVAAYLATLDANDTTLCP